MREKPHRFRQLLLQYAGGAAPSGSCSSTLCRHRDTCLGRAIAACLGKFTHTRPHTVNTVLGSSNHKEILYFFTNLLQLYQSNWLEHCPNIRCVQSRFPYNSMKFYTRSTIIFVYECCSVLLEDLFLQSIVKIQRITPLPMQQLENRKLTVNPFLSGQKCRVRQFQTPFASNPAYRSCMDAVM